jgi:hypothetical protein
MPERTVTVSDPDLGPVVLRRLRPQAVIDLWTLVARIDLPDLAHEVGPVDLGMPAEHVDEFDGHSALRLMLEFHVVIRAAVVVPEPPRWEDPPGEFDWLILPDDEWNGRALERLDVRALKLAGMDRHPRGPSSRRRGPSAGPGRRGRR